jgi:hypothetical protein
MRTLALILAFASVALRGAEESGSSVRQKLHAKIMDSLPPPTPEKPSTDLKEAGDSPVEMKPVIVSDSKLIRAVTAAIDRAEQDRRDEQFSTFDGGKIFSIGGLQVGGWWSPGEGWTFLRLNQAPTRRQAAAAETRMKELQELVNIREKPKP